jgi:hypothetical protein
VGFLALILITGFLSPLTSSRPGAMTRGQVLRNIAAVLDDHHADERCLATLVGLNRAILDRHPDLFNFDTFMRQSGAVIEGEYLSAEAHPLRVKLSSHSGSSTSLCVTEPGDRDRIADAVANELRGARARLAEEGREMCFFVPIGSPGLSIDALTFAPSLPLHARYAIRRKRTLMNSRPAVLVAQAIPS